jgi:hypothetical protein
MTTTVHDQLRIDTCRMLKYDVNALTAAQEVRLARAVVLRLELDDIESRKLQGAPFDAGKYITISEAFERLVGGDPEAPAATNDDAFAGAREELERFLAKRADALEQRELRESERLREENTRLLEENARLLRAVRQSGSEPRPAAPVDNVIPLDTNASKPKHRPWRDHYDESHGETT